MTDKQQASDTSKEGQEALGDQLTSIFGQLDNMPSEDLTMVVSVLASLFLHACQRRILAQGSPSSMAMVMGVATLALASISLEADEDPEDDKPHE